MADVFARTVPPTKLASPARLALLTAWALRRDPANRRETLATARRELAIGLADWSERSRATGWASKVERRSTAGRRRWYAAGRSLWSGYGQPSTPDG
jgi:hypothetical protein